jgi:hypothetical protein
MQYCRPSSGSQHAPERAGNNDDILHGHWRLDQHDSGPNDVLLPYIL